MFNAIGLCLNFSPPSRLTTRREISALLRGPAASPTMYLGTNDFLRLGHWHQGSALGKLPEPSDAQKNDFGMQESGQFTVELPVGKLPLPVYADPEPRLTHRVYINTGAGNHFAYKVINDTLNYTIQPGDWLEVDVQADPLTTDLTFCCGVELQFADGTAGRDIPLVDQFANADYGFNTSAFGAVGNWVTRRFDLGLAAGKTILYFDLVSEQDTVGRYSISHYKNIRITDGAGRTRKVIWASGTATANWDQYLSGTDQSTVTSPDALKLETFTPVGTAQYTYWKISTAGGRVVAANDVLEYEVFVPASSADTAGDGGIDLDFSDATFGRSIPLVDQTATHLCFFNSGAVAPGKWYRRRISLTPVVGKTITFVSLVSESDVAGQHVAYYRNILITDGNGFIRQAIYLGGNPSLNAVNYQNLNFNSSVTVVNTPRLPGSYEEWLAAIKNAPVDLDLITRTYREDGTSCDFINERRGVVKSITRKRGGVELNVVDVDRAALKTLFPVSTYTVAAWPKLFTDHVNRPIPVGVGTGEKIPCAYVDNTAGSFKYSVCQIRAGLATPTVLTVYRGKVTGQGQIVPATEYSIATTVVAGINYLLLTFVREQVDFDNQPFVIEADVLAAGSRLAADELAVILTAIGLTPDAADFNDAAAYHQSINARVDAWYTKQVTAESIVAGLLQASRGWLSQAVGGSYSLFVDRPRGAQKVLWDDSDQIQIDQRAEPEVFMTQTLRYRPRAWDSKQPWSGDLSRTTPGANGEKVYQNEFVRDHDVADRLLCYLTLKAQRATVDGTLYGVALTPGELVAVNSPLVLDGWKQLAAPSIARPAGANHCQLEEYAESDYTYTAGTLPADATNVYMPDYSYTPPVAPTSLAVISSGTTINQDGTALAYALVRAVPPAVNWAKLTAQIKNDASGEIYQAQLLLVSGNYEATITGMRPNLAHTILCWATNANGLDGATATIAHNTATYSGAPPTPSAPTLTQLVGLSVQATVPAPTYAAHARVEWQRKTGSGGTYATITGENAALLTNSNGLAYGSTFYYKARFIDRTGNAGSYSSESSILVVVQIDDSHIIGLGVGTGSLAALGVTNAKINNSDVSSGKIKYSLLSSSFSVAAGARAGCSWGDLYIGHHIVSADPDYQDIQIYAGYVGGGGQDYALSCKNIHASASRTVTVYSQRIDA